MSILLDALRKSEKDQQKLEAPSIHSGEQSKLASGFFKKRWLLLLIVVVFASSSFALYQYRKPEETFEPTANLAPDASSANEQRSSGPTGKADNDKRLAAVANDTAKKSRTPVEAFHKAAGTDTQARPGVDGKTKSAQSASQVKQVSDGGNKKPAAKKHANNNQAASKKAVNKQAAGGKPTSKKTVNKQAAGGKPTSKKAVNKQAAGGKPTSKKAVNKQAAGGKPTSKKAVNKQAAGGKPANKQAAKPQTTKNQASNKQAANQKANGKSAAKKSAIAKSAETSQKPFRPQPPAPLNYWELPDAVRAKVPEMKFTVLVYAKDPADRFVLIDGQRYGQGEQVQPELIIREIRRKGVVFKYRLYKFLVEK